MENNKFWIYLALGVVAALSLKWFGTADSATSSNRWSLQANMAEEIQYKRSAKSNDRIAGLTSPRRSTPLLTQIKSGATAAAPAAAAKKDVKLQNVAKKKDDKKKKKKKKKSKVLGVPDLDATADSDDTDIAKNNSSPNTGAATPLLFQGAAAPTANPALTDLAEWERLLLTTPNSRETTRFIALYQTKQIKAEVFYGIVGQMLNDGRSQMRQLGVMALAATPSLQSYQMLANASAVENGPVKTQATRYLDETYSRPAAIKFIYAVLIQESLSTIHLQALKNLSAIISSRTPSSQTVDQAAADTTAGAAAPVQNRNQLADQRNLMEYFKRIQHEAMPKLLQSADSQVRTLAQSVTGLLTVAINSPSQLVAPLQTASN